MNFVKDFETKKTNQMTKKKLKDRFKKNAIKIQ